MLSSLFWGCSNTENEIFIVPKSFKGYILIIFNQKNGTPARYENNKRVYEIPQNGILKTEFLVNNGWSSFPNFFYERISKENQIPYKAEFTNVLPDSIIAYGGTSGSIKKSEKSDERIIFVEFYVGTKTQIEQYKEQAEKLDIVKLAEQ